MFIEMVLAGVKRHVTEHQVRLLEAIGWKKVPGADRGVDAVKEDAPSQKSPRKPRKKKNEND